MATAPSLPHVASRRVTGPSSATRRRCPRWSRISSRISARAETTTMWSSDGGASDDADEKTRGLLRAALARGRAGAAPCLMREHCLAPERRPGGIIVQRLMLAPEAHEGDEHAVPVILVHSEAFGDDARPLVCFMHGTGGDSEGLLDTQLVPLAERGYCALGVDAPCHGRRLDPARPDPSEARADASKARVERRTTNDSTNDSTNDDAAVAASKSDHGHVSRSRSRSETFERYGAALVAAWRGGSARRRSRERSAPPQTRGRASGYSGSARPFLFDGAWDCLRAVRFATDARNRGAAFDEAPASSKPLFVDVRVDAARVGVSGVSLGGMYAWLAAAAAPETIAAAAPLIGAQDFGWALRNDQWRARVDSLPPVLFQTAARERETSEGTGSFHACTPELVERVYDAVCPGLTSELDGPRTFPLVAPRPLLIVNGELDPRNPLEGVRGVVAATRRAYESKSKSESSDAFVAVAQRGAAHACTPEMLALADAWLDARLKPAACADEERAEAAVAEALRRSETWLRL